MIVAALALELIVATTHCRDGQRGRDCRMAFNDGGGGPPAPTGLYIAVTDADDATSQPASVAFDSLKTSPWMIVDGDATFSQDGSTGSASGLATKVDGSALTVAQTNWQLNGPSTVDSILTTSSFAIRTPGTSGAFPALTGGSTFTVCVAAAWYTSGSGSATIWLNADGVNSDFELIIGANGAVQFRRQTSPGVYSSLTSGAGQFSLGAPHVFCATYDSGDMDVLVDGVSVAATSVSTSGGIAGDKFFAWANAVPDSLQFLSGAFTSQLLQPAELEAVAQAMVPRFKTTASLHSITNSRTSERACEASDGSGYTVTPKQTNCRNADGLASFRQVANLFAGQYPGVAPWLTFGVSASKVLQLGPNNDGYSAEINDASGSAGGAYQCVTTGLAAAKYTFSCYVRAGSNSGTHLILQGVGNSAGDVTCSQTGLSSTDWARVSCTSPSAYGGGLTQLCGSVNVGPNAAATGTILAHSCQLEANEFASPYVPTYSAAATAAADEIKTIATLAVGLQSKLTSKLTLPFQYSGAQFVSIGDDCEGYLFELSAAGVATRRAYVGCNPDSVILTTAPNIYAAPSSAFVSTPTSAITAPSLSFDGQSGQTGTTTNPGPTSVNRIYIGQFPAIPGQELDGYQRNICLADSASGCAGLP